MRAICECRRNNVVGEREEVKDYDSYTMYITHSVIHAGICHSGAGFGIASYWALSWALSSVPKSLKAHIVDNFTLSKGSRHNNIQMSTVHQGGTTARLRVFEIKQTT